MVGDFNADSRDDLLCFDTVTGGLWVDYASASGQFNGHDWARDAGFCNAGTNRRLMLGDFNADARQDLLCFDIASGYLWVDYANTSGQFNGTDWSRNAGWCNAYVSRTLVVGDYNGDNRDDPLCHDVYTDGIYIDYANSSAQFLGEDYSNGNAAWCRGDDQRLFIGDVNVDNRDDLVCHSVRNGFKWVDYANATGAFAGTDYTRWTSFCGGDASEMH